MDDRPVINYYKQGYSTIEIADMIGNIVTPRQIQRIVKANKLTRSQSESFKIAISKGRMIFHRKPEELKIRRKTLAIKTRYEVLMRDGYRCVKCGTTARDGYRLEVDHIDSNTRHNTIDNLQTLCNACNLGKYQVSRDK